MIGLTAAGHAGVALLAAVAGALLLRRASSAPPQLSGAALLVSGAWLLARAYLPGSLPHDASASGTATGAAAFVAGGGPGKLAPGWFLLLLPALLALGFLTFRRTRS